MHAFVQYISQPAIRSQLLIGLLLAVVMLVTRSGHYGTAFSPADASLAVFFLGGMWVNARTPAIWVFAGLLGVAGWSDQIAFDNNVSDWCVTAAYGFLIPAYGAMWFAGRYCRNSKLLSVAGPIQIAAAVTLGSIVYFAISNHSFYLFSGRYDAMSTTEYWSRTLKYFPWFLKWASIYVAAACALSLIPRLFARREAHAQ
jgi:hypothetical protein